MSPRLLFALGLALVGAALSAPKGTPEGALFSSALRVLDQSEALLDWGGRYRRVEGVTAAGRVTLHHLTADADRFRLAVAPAPEGIGALAPLAELVRGAGAVAGINASFFDPQTGLPVGFLLVDGRVLGTPYGSRGTLAVGFFGRLHFLSPRIELVLMTPQGAVPIDGVNRPAASDGLFAFTPEYAGPQGSWRGARIVAVREGRVWWVGSGWSGRPRSGEPGVTWLVATGSARARVEGLLPAQAVRLDYRMEPERFLIRDAVQAGPLLLADGQVVLHPEGFDRDFLERPAGRSALARTVDGQLLMAVAERGVGSVGIDLPTFTDHLRQLGAVDALALDGGGSSALVFRNGWRWRELGGGRKIPVGLVLVPR